jgi:hypothetical protein
MFRDDRYSLAARNQELERELATRPTAAEHRALLEEVESLRRTKGERNFYITGWAVFFIVGSLFLVGSGLFRLFFALLRILGRLL